MKKTINTQIKRIMACAMAAIMIFGLAACASSDKGASGAGGENIADIMKNAQEKINSLESMSMDMTMDMDMSIADQAVAMKTNATGDYITDPISMKMDMAIDMGELGAMSTEIYVAEDNGSLVAYTGMDLGDGQKKWQKTESFDMETLNQYNAKENFNLYIQSAESFKENGSDTINGLATKRYDGVISQDALQEVMANSGTLSSLSQLGIDESQIESMFSDLAPIPISIWIDDESGLPVKYEMDMTDMMQKLMTNIMETTTEESSKVVINKVFISMTIDNLNGVDSIQIPEEALAA